MSLGLVDFPKHGLDGRPAQHLLQRVVIERALDHWRHALESLEQETCLALAVRQGRRGVGHHDAAREHLLQKNSAQDDVGPPVFLGDDESSMETIRYMVGSGLGITVMPNAAVLNRPAEPKPLPIVPFAAPAPSRRIGMVWRRSFPRLQAIRTLREGILASTLLGVTRLPNAEPQHPS